VGLFFSRIELREAARGHGAPFRRGMFNRVGLEVGAPLAAAGLSPEALREQARCSRVPTETER
jgi:hypothetical protein